VGHSHPRGRRERRVHRAVPVPGAGVGLPGVAGEEHQRQRAQIRPRLRRRRMGGLEDLPDELIFHINYLGADQPTFTLNFSKGSSQIIARYYQLFLRLCFEVSFII
jgi:hypothetical protein